VLKLAGINRMEKRLELWPSEEGLAWVDRFFKDNWLQPGQKTVAFSLAASARWKSKNWGIQPMLELADLLARRKGIRVVLIGASGEDRLALDFMRMSTAKPMNAVGRTALPELIGLIKKCDALVTGDSAPMHIASAVGTPFVGLFGPTDPARHVVPSDLSRIFAKKARCSPCYRPVCSKHMRCMVNIRPKDVFEALIELIELKNGASARGRGSAEAH
jgi:ADP-heptose:LPS heptosyltransferase